MAHCNIGSERPPPGNAHTRLGLVETPPRLLCMAAGSVHVRPAARLRGARERRRNRISARARPVDDERKRRQPAAVDHGGTGWSRLAQLAQPRSEQRRPQLRGHSRRRGLQRLLSRALQLRGQQPAAPQSPAIGLHHARVLRMRELRRSAQRHDGERSGHIRARCFRRGQPRLDRQRVLPGACAERLGRTESVGVSERIPSRRGGRRPGRGRPGRTQHDRLPEQPGLLRSPHRHRLPGGDPDRPRRRGKALVRGLLRRRAPAGDRLQPQRPVRRRHRGRRRTRDMGLHQRGRQQPGKRSQLARMVGAGRPAAGLQRRGEPRSAHVRMGDDHQHR